MFQIDFRQLPVKRIKRGVDSFVNFDRSGITNTDQFASIIEQASAASPINGPAKDIVLDRAIVSGSILDLGMTDRWIVSMIAANAKDILSLSNVCFASRNRNRGNRLRCPNATKAMSLASASKKIN